MVKAKEIIKKILYVLAWITWLVFCYFVSQMLVFVPVEVLGIEIRNDDTLILTVLSALVYVITLVIFVLGPWLMRKRLKLSQKVTELVGLGRKITKSDVFKGIKTYLFYMVVLVGVMLAFSFFFPELSQEEQNLSFGKEGNNLWQLILIFISLVVVPPIFEELIMRGVLFGRLRSKISYWPATIITSALFAVAHGQINVMVDTFVLSLFLCNVREETGSVWASIIVHMLKNLLGFILVFVVAI